MKISKIIKPAVVITALGAGLTFACLGGSNRGASTRVVAASPASSAPVVAFDDVSLQLAKQAVNAPYAGQLSNVDFVEVKETTWGNFGQQSGALEGVQPQSGFFRSSTEPVLVEVLQGSSAIDSSEPGQTEIVVVREDVAPYYTLLVWTPPAGASAAAGSGAQGLPPWFQALPDQ